MPRPTAALRFALSALVPLVLVALALSRPAAAAWPAHAVGPWTVQAGRTDAGAPFCAMAAAGVRAAGLALAAFGRDDVALFVLPAGGRSASDAAVLSVERADGAVFITTAAAEPLAGGALIRLDAGALDALLAGARLTLAAAGGVFAFPLTDMRPAYDAVRLCLAVETPMPAPVRPAVAPLTTTEAPGRLEADGGGAEPGATPSPLDAGPTDAAIRDLLVEESIMSYPRSCPCPYNADRAGRRCGGRSAYARPGGEAPYCYANDIPASAVSAYRRDLASR